MSRHAKLFAAAFIQVSLVALNTYQIAHRDWIGVFVVGFLISLVWTFNVRRINASTMQERLVYSLGAACGSVAGMAVGVLIL